MEPFCSLFSPLVEGKETEFLEYFYKAHFKNPLLKRDLCPQQKLKQSWPSKMKISALGWDVAVLHPPRIQRLWSKDCAYPPGQSRENCLQIIFSNVFAPFFGGS